jgi:hypothetical protein
MLCHSLVVCILLAGAVLPTPSRPRTERLSRGPAWTTLRSLAIDQPAIVAAKQLRDASKRVAVVGVNPVEQPAVDAMAELIRHGLMLGKNVITVDMATSERLLNAARDPKAIREIALLNDIDIVVRVTIAASNNTDIAQVEIVSRHEETTSMLEPIRLADLDAAVLDASIVARKLVLQELEALPETNNEQLVRLPQATLKSILDFLSAKRTVMSVIAADDKQTRDGLCRAALTKLDTVIDASPDFLEAYLLKASCQDGLEQSLELKRTLTTAYQKSDPSKQNRLTLLELKGDYLRFVKSDASAALEAYLELLSADPANLTGLWSVIDILLTGDETTEPDDATIREAAEMAALLITSHPQSGVALAIVEQMK